MPGTKDEEKDGVSSIAVEGKPGRSITMATDDVAINMNKRQSRIKSLSASKTMNEATPRTRGFHMSAFAARDRSESEERMDKILNNDEKCGAYMKDLISLTDLAAAWDNLKARVVRAEESMEELVATTNRQVLERDFVLFSEYQETVKDTHANTIEHHKVRVHGLEEEADRTCRTFEKHLKKLNDLHGSCSRLEEKQREAFHELQRIDAQDSNHHKDIVDLTRNLKDECDRRENGIQNQFQDFADRLSSEVNRREKLESKVQTIQEFLNGETLMQHIRRICKELLSDYIPWTEMDKNVCKAANQLLVPVNVELDKLRRSVTLVKDDLQSKHDLANAGMKALGGRIDDHANVHNNIYADLDNRFTKNEIGIIQKDIEGRIKEEEQNLVRLSTATTMKLKDMMSRLNEFQDILKDHEHALQHQAEELLNRATKYDLIVNARKIDLCAPKEKTDAALKDIQKTLKWQTQKVEEVASRGGLGARFGNNSSTPRGSAGQSPAITPRAVGTLTVAVPVEAAGHDDSIEPSSREPSRPSSASRSRPASRPSSPPGTAKEPQKEERAKPTRLQEVEETDNSNNITLHTPATNECHMLRQQLELLASGVLIFAHLLLRQKSLDREKRQDREYDVLNHLTSLSCWLQTRRAPSAWDPSRLQSLALQCQVDVQGQGVPKTPRKGVQIVSDFWDGGGEQITRSKTLRVTKAATQEEDIDHVVFAKTPRPSHGPSAEAVFAQPSELQPEGKALFASSTTSTLCTLASSGSVPSVGPDGQDSVALVRGPNVPQIPANRFRGKAPRSTNRDNRQSVQHGRARLEHGQTIGPGTVRELIHIDNQRSKNNSLELVAAPNIRTKPELLPVI